ncbi:MAG: 2-oxoglutarate ferredoxin oxidoreductase subunit gamma [Candidatus Edwardsbacteria bacterium RIFOXYD12_FULL_50_11]|jgi:2-oxoglutarate ferredoxin oxidoreductase subunit gamma|uniref:2-oxoglutarate ferredoxin oxidoreductase subunit gamma n=1 Tax=Candidatus Edwardsbacteria bacterium GWF2_54_11 TaxID=1817851 RepID=A0A1F5R4N1_9BACT|nr:MAG: 2-oxoglutarate ferredoxin oxidoreductase subunit gamma [Candidatus Edwardsbacteria bacterium RifOxyC12_full_54_24]OGF06660.1 MAG: 2-oxoglutarate ferredoxin oxidoreductase subunit gamma [Candidatus Edwardsbacteria bacterium RifOxyA12_full_54_48]OGF09425.1 MAG: 2-oxoglutarate ferredoxin oxidoreductase subunit gamma [Candidatus Edwardsbacteria bacterium GWF2_54_11]OGF10611.1 MAG: 2-oxoglutarate ferredoxin oxidoreductase subunit gamma [Candidatus Edwardsbacteria bacterium GWE2_54_12]OGF1704
MKNRYEIRLSGSGGQGMITAGIVLAEAAGVYDGKNVVQSQSYGPEARGGASKAEVIISDKEIFYPKATAIDILLAMTQEAWEKYSSDLNPDAVAIVDSWYVKNVDKPGVISLPLSLKAREEVGLEIIANVIALAAIAQITGVVSREALEKSLLSRIPKGTEEKNKKALEIGFQLGKEAKK